MPRMASAIEKTPVSARGNIRAVLEESCTKARSELVHGTDIAWRRINHPSEGEKEEK
jgi:hypothetical protein